MAQLAASALNQPGQYAWSQDLPFCRTCRLFPINSSNHRQYLFRLHTEGWPGWVGLGGLDQIPRQYTLEWSPISLQTRFNVDQLYWCAQQRYQ